MTYFEVLQGMRNKVELAAFKQMLAQRSASVLPLTEAITEQAIVLLESLNLSHGLQMGDALIASTALVHQLPLLTGNIKHFAPIQRLRVEEFLI